MNLGPLVQNGRPGSPIGRGPALLASLLMLLGGCRPHPPTAPPTTDPPTTDQRRAAGPPATETAFWIDTDIGQDVDDLLALLVAARRCGPRLVGVSTVTWWPVGKARLARLVLQRLGRQTVPVYAGLGLMPGDEEQF